MSFQIFSTSPLLSSGASKEARAIFAQTEDSNDLADLRSPADSLLESFRPSKSQVEDEGICLDTFSTDISDFSDSSPINPGEFIEIDKESRIGEPDQEADFLVLQETEANLAQPQSASYLSSWCTSFKGYIMNYLYNYYLPSAFDLPEFSSGDVHMINGKHFIATTHNNNNTTKNESNNNEESAKHEENNIPFADFVQEFHSLLWFSYRKDFAAITPSTYSNDSGWGCMLRCGQMILGQALINHFLGKEWRLVKDQPIPGMYYRIVKYFADLPSAPYSVHKIAQRGASKYGKQIGEWFGPSTIAQVLCELVTDHNPGELVMYTSNDSTLYLDEISQLCIEQPPPSDTINNNSNNNNNNYSNPVWKPLFILLPLRLGLEGVNPVYVSPLQTLFRLPQFLGIVGGKPRAAMYFVACQDDQVFYLDPHLVQPSLPFQEEDKEHSDHSMQQQQQQHNPFATETFHCSVPKKMSITAMDPSLALGFYCSNKNDFDTLWTSLQTFAKEEHPLFGVAEQAPDYRSQKPRDNLTLEEFEDDIVII